MRIKRQRDLENTELQFKLYALFRVILIWIKVQKSYNITQKSVTILL